MNSMSDLKIEIFDKPQQLTLGSIRFERYMFRALFDQRFVTTGYLSRAVSQHGGASDTFYFDLSNGRQVPIPYISRIDTVGNYHRRGFATKVTIAANDFAFSKFGIPIHSDVKFDCASSRNRWVRLENLGAAEQIVYKDHDGNSFQRWRMKAPHEFAHSLPDLL